MNKKASILDGMIWIIIAFITLVVFAGLYYLHIQVYEGLSGAGSIGATNISNITETVFAPATDGMLQGLNILGFIIIVGGAFSILVHNFLIRIHPVFFIAYLIMTILTIIVSAYISNQYMALLSNDVIGSTLQQMTMGTFVMQYLPYWAAVIGIVGSIFLFIGIIRDREISGGFQ